MCSVTPFLLGAFKPGSSWASLDFTLVPQCWHHRDVLAPNHAYTEDQSKEPVFEVATVAHGHGALMHVGSWACKTLGTPRDLLYMFPQTSGRCGVSGASVTSPVLPSLCSGLC